MAFESTNPATGKLLNIYPEHSAQEVDVRLQSAWDGWKKWSRTPLSERTAFLIRLADLLEKRADDYARLITLEMGKPIGEALGEVKKAAFGARYFAGVKGSGVGRELGALGARELTNAKLVWETA